MGSGKSVKKQDSSNSPILAVCNKCNLHKPFRPVADDKVYFMSRKLNLACIININQKSLMKVSLSKTHNYNTELCITLLYVLL